jgi:hypothetical protein
VPAHGRMFGLRARHRPHVRRLRRHRRRPTKLVGVGPGKRPKGAAGLALVLLVAAVTALGVLVWRPDGGGVPQRVPITTVPADNPRLGLVYQGLAPARHGTPCVGAYQVVAPDLCTHGPDEPPAGLDVLRDVAPVAPGSPTPTLARQNIATVPGDEAVWPDAGASAGSRSAPGVGVLVPDARADTVRPDGVVCDGDGDRGKRVQVLYVYQTGTASRYSQYLASFRAWAAGVDAVFDSSAAETGGVRHVRYVTTPDCEVAVAEVEVPAGALRTFNATIAVLRSLGYQRADRKYMIFADANVYCGIATFAGDDRAGPDNRSNRSPGYGRADAGCWNPAVAAHELAHNLGAVHNSAPNSSRAGHCVDGYDVMCYPGADVPTTRLPCPHRADARLLDCDHDDYFNSDPEPGSYLATHWNVADSQFLIDGAAGEPEPAPVPAPAPAAPGAASEAASGAAPDGAVAASGPAPAEPPNHDRARPNRRATGQPAEPPAATPARPAATTPGGPAAATRPPASPGPVTTTAPAAPPAASLVPLRVEATAATAVRVTWPPDGTGTSMGGAVESGKAQYGVLVNGVVVGSTTATAARVIGLHPGTTYRLQVVRDAKAGGDFTPAGPYTETATARTPAAQAPPPGRWFTLGNALTGATATLYAARAGSGAPLVLQPGTGAANQDWQLQSAEDGSYLLRSRATGKCVVPRGGLAVPGAPLVQQSCPSLPAAGQRWRVTRTAYGFCLTAVLDDKPASVAAPAGPLVIGVGVARFGGDRLLVLQRPSQARHQSWTALP